MMRARLGCLGWLSVGLFACEARSGARAVGDYSGVPEVVFDSVFRRVASVKLAPDSADPVGFPGALLVRNGRAFLADPLQSNVKMYDVASGRRLGILGRLGNGPGEFRLPLSLALANDGSVLVLDATRRTLSRWDTTGHFLEENRVPGGFSVVLTPPFTDTLLLAGYAAAGDSSPGKVASRKVLHEAGSGGASLAGSYLAWAIPEHPWAGSFSTVTAAWIDSVVVVGTMAGNAVKFLNRRTHREWAGAIGARWYRAPDWPSSIPTGSGGMVDAMNAWSRRQDLLVRLLPSDHGRFVAQFQGYEADGGRVYSYVLADTTGASLGSIHRTPAKLLAMRGSTAWGIRLSEDGEVVLDTYEVGSF